MYKTAQEFFDKYNGKGVNHGVGWNDSAFGYQCVAGFKAYCEFEGVPVIPTGNGWANGYWFERYNNGMAQYFEFIDDVSQLKQGDWCIWDFGSSCPQSHIAMYWKGVNGSHAQFFGQNQSGKPYFSLENIKLDILGAYRLRENPSTNIKMYGIDVSVHNDINAIDFSQVDFVIIRATWGTNLDEKANEWRLKCESLGIPYGVYCYSYALDDIGAKEEADYILQIIKNWNVRMGVWYDMENDSYKQTHGFVTAEQWTSACRVFCKAIQEAGYYTGIYSSQSFFNSHIHVNEYDKWVASWGTNDGTIQRDTSDMGTILQYTSYPNLDKNVSYCELDHYKSYPIDKKEEDKKDEEDKKEDKKDEGGVVPMPDDDYLFKMSNLTYDFLNWLVHITPLAITLYITLAKTWNWDYTEPIVATMGAVMAFVNSILKQSTIGYKERKDGKK